MKLFSFKKKKPSNLLAEVTKKFSGKKDPDRFEHRRDVSKTGAKEEKPVEGKAEAVQKSEKAAPILPVGKEAQLLIRPRISEKATFISEKYNAYSFDVHKDANKEQIEQAVREIYKVNPVKIRMVKVPSKGVLSRGKKGVKPGGKKAYVYLKKGESIEFV